jgi:hypothetical protein
MTWTERKKFIYLFQNLNTWPVTQTVWLEDDNNKKNKKVLTQKSEKKWQEKVDDSIFAQKTDKKKYCISEDWVYGAFTSLFSLKSSFNEITDLDKFQP